MRGLPTRQLNSDFGLQWTDYGARFYDAAIARWHSIDPMADFRLSLTPYQYAQNNPFNRIDLFGMIDVEGGGGGKKDNVLPEVVVTAQRSEAAPQWKAFIGQWSNDDFQDFRKNVATPYLRREIPRQNNDSKSMHTSMWGISSFDDDDLGADYEASEDDAMSLLKDFWASENSSFANYSSIRAEAVSSTQEGIHIALPPLMSALSSYIGAWESSSGIRMNAAKEWGPRANWIRMDKSYSVTGKFHTYGIKWGASPGNKGKYLKQIGSGQLKEFNQYIRNIKIPGNNWRVVDPGHLHFRKL